MKKNFFLFDSHPDSYPLIEDNIRNTAIPSVCTMPLRVSDREYTPVVGIGKRVEEGEVIAKCEMPGVAHTLYLYSPIPGIIFSIKNISLSESLDIPAIQINLEGSFSILGKQVKRKKWNGLSRKEIQERLISNDSNNISVDLLAKKNSNSSVLIVQISDPEPYMSGDRQVFHLYPQQVMEGMMMVERMHSLKETIIICPSSCKKLIAKFLPENEDGHRRSVYYFDLFKDYVQMSSYTHAQILRKHFNNASNALTVVSASILHTLYETVTTARPVFERVISIGGEGVVKPLHLKVRIGTSLGEVLRVCGGMHLHKNAFVLIGGPFTGTRVEKSTVPIGINTSAILVLTEKQSHKTNELPCIQCDACSQVCPAELQPRMLVKMIENNKKSLAIQNGLYDCIECGLCSYVCPSRIQLLRQLQIGKEEGK